MVLSRAQTISLLETFYRSTKERKQDIHLSHTNMVIMQRHIAKKEKDKLMISAISLVRSDISPDVIAEKLKEDAAPILELNANEVSEFLRFPTRLQDIQYSLTTIIPGMDFAAADWKSIAPREISYADTFKYATQYQDAISSALDVSNAAYSLTVPHIEKIMDHTAYILNDMGVKIK